MTAERICLLASLTNFKGFSVEITNQTLNWEANSLRLFSQCLSVGLTIQKFPVKMTENGLKPTFLQENSAKTRLR
jgi:hypothetical protein